MNASSKDVNGVKDKSKTDKENEVKNDKQQKKYEEEEKGKM